MAELTIPDLCLVVLVGASGSGKSTFAAANFAETEVVSSDRARAMITDDPNDQSIHQDAFELVRYWAGKRLANGRLTVIDATNVQASSRRPLIELAREHDVLPVAIVLDTPAEVCRTRNRARSDRDHRPRVINKHIAQLRRSLGRLKKEGFRHVYHLDGVDEIDDASIVRRPRWTDLRDRSGPFDIVGDVHGCHRELVDLLGRLGYTIDDDGGGPIASHDDGRNLVFVGDLVDRGPGVCETLELVMNTVEAGNALCVAGNHEAKLVRALEGRDVKRTHGLAETMDQLAGRDDEFAERVKRFLGGLISHYVLDDGHLVVSHAGLPERYHNRSSGRVRSFCLYGETTGETDEFGLPIRYRWADDYRGKAAVVYGHTPVPDAVWVNNTICLDTGCVFGGKLTALRWPERELVSIDADACHYEPIRPLVEADDRPAQGLDLGDVIGRRHVETSLMGRLTIQEELSAAALEVLSRFTVEPGWLPYLPPTMAPVATAEEGPVLERPAEAFAYFAGQGIETVICQEKHMGSRAVAVLGRTPDVLAERFGPGVAADQRGLIVTRTGRRFFDRADLESAAVAHLVAAVDGADLFAELDAEWLILDGELLPWSVKAGPLIREQYAAVGAAGALWAPAASAALAAASTRGVPGLTELAATVAERGVAVNRFRHAYRHHVTDLRVTDLRITDLSLQSGGLDGLDGVQYAPFAVVATSRAVTARNDNRWQLATCDRLVEAGGGFLRRTERLEVEPGDHRSMADAERWWGELTARGGEGMVVKPLNPVSAGRKGLIQPGLKCRGPEYLRLVYGPDYDAPANLERLRNRGLNRKRSLAIREFALGIEGLDRLVRAEPLWRVHECVAAVLALQSDPVDPRL